MFVVVLTLFTRGLLHFLRVERINPLPRPLKLPAENACKQYIFQFPVSGPTANLLSILCILIKKKTSFFNSHTDAKMKTKIRLKNLKFRACIGPFQVTPWQ